jgi:hypothetical protein
MSVRPKKDNQRRSVVGMQVTNLQATGWDHGGGEIVRFFLLCCVAGALTYLLCVVVYCVLWCVVCCVVCVMLCCCVLFQVPQDVSSILGVW